MLNTHPPQIDENTARFTALVRVRTQLEAERRWRTISEPILGTAICAYISAQLAKQMSVAAENGSGDEQQHF
jgi:hypothetical protein